MKTIFAAVFLIAAPATLLSCSANARTQGAVGMSMDAAYAGARVAGSTTSIAGGDPIMGFFGLMDVIKTIGGGKTIKVVEPAKVHHNTFTPEFLRTDPPAMSSVDSAQ